jgi:hypothetical protein
VAPHPDPLPEGEGLVDKDNSMGSKISFRTRKGCAKKINNSASELMAGLKQPTPNPEDPKIIKRKQASPSE